jgi:hypothetical protein
MANTRDETEEIEVFVDWNIEDLHGVEEETHVSGESTPSPALTKRPREFELFHNLTSKASSLVFHIEVNATPIIFSSNEL